MIAASMNANSRGMVWTPLVRGELLDRTAVGVSGVAGVDVEERGNCNRFAGVRPLAVVAAPDASVALMLV